MGTPVNQVVLNQDITLGVSGVSADSCAAAMQVKSTEHSERYGNMTDRGNHEEGREERTEGAVH